MKSGKLCFTSYRAQVLVMTSEFWQSTKSFTTACDMLLGVTLFELVIIIINNNFINFYCTIININFQLRIMICK